MNQSTVLPFCYNKPLRKRYLVNKACSYAMQKARHCSQRNVKKVFQIIQIFSQLELRNKVILNPQHSEFLHSSLIAVSQTTVGGGSKGQVKSGQRTLPGQWRALLLLHGENDVDKSLQVLSSKNPKAHNQCFGSNWCYVLF